MWWRILSLLVAVNSALLAQSFNASGDGKSAVLTISAIEEFPNGGYGFTWTAETSRTDFGGSPCFVAVRASTPVVQAYIGVGAAGTFTASGVGYAFPEIEGPRKFFWIDFSHGKASVKLYVDNLEESLRIVITNLDDRTWNYRFAAIGDISGKGGVIGAGGNSSVIYTRSELESLGAVYGQFDARITYKEFANPPPDAPWWTTDSGGLVRPSDSNAEALTMRTFRFGAGPYAPAHTAYPQRVFNITIPAGTAKNKNDKDIVFQNPTMPPDAPTPPGNPLPSGGNNNAPNDKNLDADKTNLVDETGAVRKGTVLPDRIPGGISGNSDDSKAVVETLIQNQERSEVLWERHQQNSDRRTKEIVDALGGGSGDTGIGSGSEAGMGTKLSEGQSRAANATPYTGAKPAAAAPTTANLPSAPTSAITSFKIGAETIPVTWEPVGAVAPAFTILTVCRPLLLWAAAIGFVYGCRQILTNYLVSIPLIPQVQAQDSTVAGTTVPGTGALKTWVTASMLVTVVMGAAAAAVALIDQYLLAGGSSVTVLNVFTLPDFSILGPGVGLMNKFIPIGAMIAYGVMTAFFPMVVAPLYFACVTAIKFMKI